MTTHNRHVLLTADGYTLDRTMRLVPVEMTPEHRIDTINREDFGLTMRSDYAEAIAAAPSPDPAVFADADMEIMVNCETSLGHVITHKESETCSCCCNLERKP